MKINLYSRSHLSTAKTLFPERLANQRWFSDPWTAEELHACMKAEMESFIASPVLNYPFLEYIAKETAADEVMILHQHLNRLSRSSATFLSIGCGQGEKELWLAKRHPHVNFKCVDRFEYVTHLNAVARALEIRNIEFSRHDGLDDGKIGEFDIVYSMGVIYCVPDEKIGSFIQNHLQNLAQGGTFFLGCVANISNLLRLKLKVSGKRDYSGWKQIGWMRDARETQRLFPKDLLVEKLYPITHHGQAPNSIPIVGKLIQAVSKNVFPLSNSSYLFELTIKN